MDKADPPVSEFIHVPVLGAEVVEGLAVHAGGHYLDATVGGGGHSRLMLEAAADVQVTALDQDGQAIAAAQQSLSDFKQRVHFQHTNFATFEPGSTQFDGILADLGVSSAQFDIPDRGFSFRLEAPPGYAHGSTPGVNSGGYYQPLGRN